MTGQSVRHFGNKEELSTVSDFVEEPLVQCTDESNSTSKKKNKKQNTNKQNIIKRIKPEACL